MNSGAMLANKFESCIFGDDCDETDNQSYY